MVFRPAGSGARLRLSWWFDRHLSKFRTGSHSHRLHGAKFQQAADHHHPHSVCKLVVVVFHIEFDWSFTNTRKVSILQMETTVLLDLCVDTIMVFSKWGCLLRLEVVTTTRKILRKNTPIGRAFSDLHQTYL